MSKLSKAEQRAKESCEIVRKHGGWYQFGLVWKKSTYGWCPTCIDWSGEKLVRAGGYGYDKESSALAASLRFLGETPEAQQAIWETGGAGFDTLVRVAAEHGVKIEKVYHGESEHGYRVEVVKVTHEESLTDARRIESE